MKLKIADIVISLDTRLRIEPFIKKRGLRYNRFIYKGSREPGIKLRIIRAEKRPNFHKLSKIFSCTRPANGKANWNLFRNGNKYLIEQHGAQGLQCATLNKNFNRGVISLLLDKDNSGWVLENIVYDFLQKILMSYLSFKDGMFVHSAGLEDINGRGFLFAGRSESGKSTMAQFWQKHTRARVFNDDRVIIRKQNNKFFIFGGLWHGYSNDYSVSGEDKAVLDRIFFIYRAKGHKVRALNLKESCRYFYPNIFPVFWDRGSLKRQFDLCHEIANSVPAYRFGFKKDKSLIGVVRSLLRDENKSAP
jgi:hypothetical protein